ncbi:MAG: [protein-PII] uridylyltransferase, partial [Pseudomonadota bacterium]
MSEVWAGKGLAAAMEGLRTRLAEVAESHKDVTAPPGRNEVLQAVSKALDEGREACREALEARQIGGLAVARALSDLQDGLIDTLMWFAREYALKNHKKAFGKGLCLVATGGYGRATLAPGSDIDLMVLYADKLTPHVEKLVEFLLYVLWDLGQQVGHATRSIEECIRLSQGDYTIRTALLEARYLSGDEALFANLIDTFDAEILKGNSADFIEAKLAERDQRHKGAGESRYLVEPNIKDGKGGLRDLHTLFWIGKHVYRVANPEDFVSLGLLTDQEFVRFQEAEAFLWQVRCHLHFLAGRAEERLTFDRQIEMAVRLGYSATRDQKAVERFMTDYFRVAKDVGDLTRIICADLELKEQKFWPAIGEFFRAGGRRTVGAHGLAVERGRLDATDEGVLEADPVTILRVFQIADQLQTKIHPRLLTLITRSLDLIDDELRSSAEANQVFMEVLTSRQDPERALRSMNEAGVLGAFVPEFGRIVAMMQFNMYHHYTVDEHTIRCVGNLALIERGELAHELPLSDKIIHQVVGRDALFVAMLLHDIAKGQEGDHSEIGAEIARRLGPRFGLNAATTDTVAWLVENHLLMSDYAQRRDISDSRTIEDCARIIQSPERLRLLLCLTVADIRGVGPGVWNGWKGELLRQLYFEVEAHLQGGHSAVLRPDIVGQKREAVEQGLTGWSVPVRAAVLDDFEDPYWRAFDTATHERHAALIRRSFEAKEGEAVAFISAAPDDFRDVTQVSIYTDDRPGLFALLAGAITGAGGSIADAKGFTARSRKVIDVFWVQDFDDSAFDDPIRIERLDALVNRLLISGEGAAG